MKQLVVSELIATARQATGLDDFGEPPLHPALDQLVDSINAEAHLSDFGVEAQMQGMVSMLVNRLNMTELLKRRPDVASAPIGTPIFVVGLPRSGTTKTQRIIAADSRLNYSAMWETLFPVPLSDAADDREQRIAYAQAFGDALSKLPSMNAIHEFGPLVPDEDVIFMQHSFLSEAADPQMRVPSFIRWLRTQNRTAAYRQHANWLRILADAHGKTDEPWVLKGTYHGTQLDTLFEVLPNAKIVYCHRDPVDNIPSYCSLLTRLRSLLSSHVDNHELGREVLEYWSGHLCDMIAVRKRLPEGKVFDLPYTDIVNRLPETLEKIYAFAGIPLTDAARDQHQAWESENAIHKHGPHEYNVADYGLTNKQIADACAEYREMFIKS